jgi:hypothetical protein
MDRNRRATALLVFFAAAAGTWVVASDAHFGKGEYTAHALNSFAWKNAVLYSGTTP